LKTFSKSASSKNSSFLPASTPEGNSLTSFLYCKAANGCFPPEAFDAKFNYKKNDIFLPGAEVEVVAASLGAGAAEAVATGFGAGVAVVVVLGAADTTGLVSTGLGAAATGLVSAGFGVAATGLVSTGLGAGVSTLAGAGLVSAGLGAAGGIRRELEWEYVSFWLLL
jgi:hypothetical protein